MGISTTLPGGKIPGAIQSIVDVWVNLKMNSSTRVSAPTVRLTSVMVTSAGFHPMKWYL
ncbi:MAG: hypothetical protein WBS22_03980 [Methylocystis sp.]